MKAKSELMREKILDGVVELFIEKGIENVTTRELTEYIGVSRSHIYHYFKDWQSLSIEAVANFMRSELAEFRTIITPLPAIQKLQEFIHGMISEEPDPTRKLYGSLWLLSTHNGVYAEQMQFFLEEWHKVLTYIIDSGIEEGVFQRVDVHRTARQLDAMLFGYSEHLFTLPSSVALLQAKEDIESFIERNLLSDNIKVL
ncbi:TetR/AcrR family transcriptional regulator [Serratia nevei]|uniref:TetR/AcrR family transcriptional regulator n=1 Tax=Serratia nevei TaxID=2703794 RepID=UPI00313AFD04